MKKTLQTTLALTLTVLAIDFIAFWAWVMSGQYPAGEVYAGTITAHLIAFLV